MMVGRGGGALLRGAIELHVFSGNFPISWFPADQDADQRASARKEEIPNPGIRRLLRQRWGPAYCHKVTNHQIEIITFTIMAEAGIENVMIVRTSLSIYRDEINHPNHVTPPGRLTSSPPSRIFDPAEWSSWTSQTATTTFFARGWLSPLSRSMDDNNTLYIIIWFSSVHHVKNYESKEGMKYSNLCIIIGLDRI